MDLGSPRTPAMLRKNAIVWALGHKPSCDVIAQKVASPQVIMVGLCAEPENQGPRPGSSSFDLWVPGKS